MNFAAFLTVGFILILAIVAFLVLCEEWRKERQRSAMLVRELRRAHGLAHAINETLVAKTWAEIEDPKHPLGLRETWCNIHEDSLHALRAVVDFFEDQEKERERCGLF